MPVTGGNVIPYHAKTLLPCTEIHNLCKNLVRGGWQVVKTTIIRRTSRCSVTGIIFHINFRLKNFRTDVFLNQRATWVGWFNISSDHLHQYFEGRQCFQLIITTIIILQSSLLTLWLSKKCQNIWKSCIPVKNEDACMLWHIRIIRKLLSVLLRLSCLQEDYDTDEAISRHVYLLRLFGLSQCLQVLFLQSSPLTHLSHTWYKQSSWTRLWYLSCSSHSQHCYHPRFQLHSKWYCNRLVFLENLRLANDSIWPLGS